MSGAKLDLSIHRMFCEAKTCTECGATRGYVLPVYDSTTDPPERRCETCLEEDYEEDYDDEQ